MAAHLHALLRAKLSYRLVLHAQAHLTTPRRTPAPPPHQHADFFLRAPLAMPARGLAARASRKNDAAIGTPLPTPVAGAGCGDGKADAAAAAKMVTATKKGAAVLDLHIPDDMKKSWHVLQAGNEIYDAALNQTNVVGANNNKFFIIRALESDDGTSFMVYWRYGRVGHRGRTELMGPMPRNEAIRIFKFKFEDKTNNEWFGRHNFRCYAKKYTWLEMDYGKERDKAQTKEFLANQIKKTRLETRIAHFISVICDISMMKQQMVEIGYNADKLALGKVRTVDGTSELRIPPGTQPGDVLVLAKQGVPSLNRPSIRGDHLFTIKVSIPKRISGREKELLEELASLTNGGFAHAPVKPKPTRQETASSVAQVPDQPDEEEVDWLKKLSDFAGSIVNGASKWLKDNL